MLRAVLGDRSNDDYMDRVTDELEQRVIDQLPARGALTEESGFTSGADCVSLRFGVILLGTVRRIRLRNRMRSVRF
jgi:hypothetical protein